VLASPFGRWVLGGSWAAIAGAVGTSLASRPVAPAVFAGLGIAGVVTLGAGVAWQRSGIFARPLVAVRTPRPELALTFDDGPHPDGTDAVLDRLDAAGHRATFFVIGERAARHRQLLAEIARRGHAVGNHTWAHAYTTPFTSPRRLTEELRRTTGLLEDATGQKVRWMRAPMGLLSPRVAAAARKAGLTLVGWTATARDGVSRRTAQNAVARLLPAATPGAILTLHDGAMGNRSSIAPAVLDALLPLLGERGLRSVTLDSLLAPAPPAGDSPMSL
jgi:peptidoglycan/xylan/chitin deacetylase (PgdA/CDA1 family)